MMMKREGPYRHVHLVYTYHVVIQFRVHRLTWHEGRIPADEIWIKLCGDKGGGSFKMCFQICNVPHPNSPANTCAFCVFEAPDSFTNLKVGLQRFQDQVDNLQNRKWRYKLNTTQIVIMLWCVRVYRGKTIRVFLSGDYEFLCNIFGLSGASGKTNNLNIHTSHKNWIGRHNCLWCLVTSEQLRSPPANIPSRSTDSIIQDHQRFLAAGGKLKNVKHFNNCVREPFFKGIPLNHVRLLHCINSHPLYLWT